jgi:Domain of unknown function (DUF4398)
MDKQTARVCTSSWVIALALTAGCGVTPETKEAVARSETAVTQAQQTLGNAETGAMELQSARSRLDEAKRAVDDGKDKEALRLAEEATLTAQLATAKNRTAAVRKVADETRAGIETLRQESQRPAEPVR